MIPHKLGTVSNEYQPLPAARQLAQHAGVDWGVIDDRVDAIRTVNQLATDHFLLVSRSGFVYDGDTGAVLGNLLIPALGE